MTAGQVDGELELAFNSLEESASNLKCQDVRDQVNVFSSGLPP